MIDTHSHVYLEEFKEDQDQVIQRALDAGVERIYMPNIDPRTITDLKATADKYPICKPMMGLHPGSVNENYMEQLAMIFKELESDRKYCAVGEIGIDLYWDKTFEAEQLKAFAIQITKAKEMGLPIVIHCREAFDEVFGILDAYHDENLYGIFHCFTGNEEQAKKAISLNMKLGIGGIVTFKNAGLDTVVRQIDLKHIVLETDAPYLAPVPFRGKQNEPSYLKYVAEKICDIKGITLEELDDITTRNALEVFRDI